MSTRDRLAAQQRRSVRHRVAVAAICGAVAAAIAALWLFTPLREWIDVRRLVELIGRFGDTRTAPLVAIAAFAVGGVLFVPVNLLIAACILAFGPLTGALYALLGVELNAVLLYEIGRHLSTATLRSRFGARVLALRKRLAHHGALAVALVRVVPVAPYSVVNLVAGAAHVRRAPYMLGTALGMLPGIVVNALFIDRVMAAVEQPSVWSYAMLAAAAVAVLALAAYARRRVARAREAR